MDSFEEVRALRATEYHHSNCLLYDACTRSILRLIDFRVALSLTTQESPSHGRPSEVRRVCEMEDVVEPITIGIADVVRQTVPNAGAVPVKGHRTPVAMAVFLKLDGKVTRE